MAIIAGMHPKYQTPEEMQVAIDRYFKDCDGEFLEDGDGEMVLDKYDRPIIVNARPPTVTGLALALGFASRQSLIDYHAKKAFSDTITRAKARCEEYAERRLYDRDGQRGAEFNLRHNFKWGQNTDAEAAAGELAKISDVLVSIRKAAENARD